MKEKDAKTPTTEPNQTPAPAGVDACQKAKAIDTPPPAPLFVDTKGLAAMLGVCPHTIMRMDDSGQLPAPARFGTPGSKRAAKRWYIPGINDWIEAGRPSREKWEAMKKRK